MKNCYIIDKNNTNDDLEDVENKLLEDNKVLMVIDRKDATSEEKETE